MERRTFLASGAIVGALVGPPVKAASGPRQALPQDRSHIAGSDGASLFVRKWGEGRPILFVHAWALQSTMWDRQMCDFSARGYACHAFGRRAHGRSEVTSTGFDLDTLADDLASVLEGLDLSDVLLFGHSMGCNEIVRYIARHGSERIRKVVLLAPMTPCLIQTANNPYGAPATYFEGIRQVWIDDYPHWIEENKDPFFTPNTSEETKEWMVDMMLSAWLPAIVACNVAVMAADLRPDLARIDVPTMVIHGECDVSAPIDITGRRTAAGIQGATLITYPDAPHGLFLSHRGQLLDDITRFDAA